MTNYFNETKYFLVTNLDEGLEWLKRFSSGTLVLDSEAVCPNSGILPRVSARWSLLEFGGARELILRDRTYVFSMTHVVPYRRNRDAWISLSDELSSRYLNDSEAEEGRLTSRSHEFYLE